MQRKVTLRCAYLLGLLAMIKCSICSYQCDNWYVSNWRLACHINFCLGRCFLELAQKPLCVALAWHFARRSTPFEVTTLICACAYLHRGHICTWACSHMVYICAWHTFADGAYLHHAHVIYTMGMFAPCVCSHHVHIYTCIHIFTHVHICTCAYLHMCIFTHVHIRPCASAHVQVHMQVCMCMCMCMAFRIRVTWSYHLGPFTWVSICNVIDKSQFVQTTLLVPDMVWFSSFENLLCQVDF